MYNILQQFFYNKLQLLMKRPDYKDNPNNIELRKIIASAGLSKPGAAISKATGYDKGNISSFINNKKPVPDTLIEKLYDYYNLKKSVVEKVVLPDEMVVKEAFEQYVIPNKNGNIIESLPGGGFMMHVPLIPIKAYGRYISEGDHAEHLDGYESVYFKVTHVGKGKYRAFEIKGDSMWNEGGYDTPDKAIVLARELGRHHWPSGFHESVYGWIIVTRENIVFKDIVGFDKTNGIITCHSRNKSPEYSDFTLSLDNDVQSIWKVIKRQF